MTDPSAQELIASRAFRDPETDGVVIVEVCRPQRVERTMVQLGSDAGRPWPGEIWCCAFRIRRDDGVRELRASGPDSLDVLAHALSRIDQIIRHDRLVGRPLFPTADWFESASERESKAAEARAARRAQQSPTQRAQVLIERGLTQAGWLPFEYVVPGIEPDALAVPTADPGEVGDVDLRWRGQVVATVFTFPVGAVGSGGVPAHLPESIRPLAGRPRFVYETDGDYTYFLDRLLAAGTWRRVDGFHRPEELLQLLADAAARGAPG